MITRRAVTAGLATTVIGLAGRATAQTATPSPVSVDGLKGNGLGWTVTAKPRSLRLRPDAAKDADLWMFNGEMAPVFRLKHGAEVRLSFENETPQPLSLHFHGVRGPNEMDGVGGLTQKPVGPGDSFFYIFTPPDPGTFLIRPCVLGSSAQPQERGLSGILVVEDAETTKIDQDVVLLVDDWALAEDGSLALDEPAPAGRLGSFLSVNGKPPLQQIEAPPGGQIRLRIANACNARGMRLRFLGLKPNVIAVDGQPSNTFEPLLGSLPLAPGNRYDLLITMPTEAGSAGMVMASIANGLPLLEIIASSDSRVNRSAMDPLPLNPKLPDAIKLQNATRRDVVINGDLKALATPWTVNGVAGQPSNAPLVKVKRGTPVVLALKNETGFVQPMHLHGHSFRLLHPLDDGWEPYWLDTVQVPENKTIRIAFVADNPGKWLLASTIMERFDAGLWTWIEVT
ncbi:multicopper oxidase family protein [Microvirga calopogonii]|uniref:multicopper oxidase family protein n=1 Tax=Microvirga calopogonii TaxID=2078013 RepID=UPI000E0DB3D0|nr:multicopper oxidase family protein [Microvirga calopogonii]